MRSLLGGHGVGGVACSPFSRCGGVVEVCGQWLVSCLALVLCRSQALPSCMKVSLSHKEKNTDLRTLATWGAMLRFLHSHGDPEEGSDVND